VAAGGSRGSRSRRVTLPGVHELLRPSGRSPAADAGRQASGREQHSQKITVYLSSSELLDLERARLALRGYGIAADRGRIVREALAVLLADLDARGMDSLLARRIASANRADPDSDATAGGARPGSTIEEHALQEHATGTTESA